MAKISWVNSSGGTWSTGSNWSNGVVPGPNDNVTIAIAPGQGLAGYTVELNTDAVVKSLALDQAAATLQVGDGSGDGTLATKLKLEAGTLALADGTLSGVVADTGGLLVLSDGNNYDYYGAGTLQDVTWQGDLQPELGGNIYEGTLSILGSLTLTGARGSGPGTMTLDQGNGGVNFVDTQMLDNATVYLGANNVYEQYAFLSSSSDGNGAAALTLGANLIVDVSGYGAIYDAGQLTNAGTITTSGTTSLELISQYYGDAFTNSGVMNINAGAEAVAQIYDFVNTGSIDVTAGGTFDLSYTSDGINTFQNSGSFVDDGTIQFDGSLTTSMIEGLNIDYGAGGEMALSEGGTLNNADATLDLGNGGIAPAFAVAGTINGGTITENGGDLVGAGGTLNGVALNGPLLLTGSYSAFSIFNGLQLDPGATLSITGDGAGLYFDDTETLEQAVVNLGSSDGATLGASYGATLTLGSSVQVNVDGGMASLGTSYDNEIINQGTIDVTGGAFTYFGLNGGAFVNQGAFSVSNGSTLLLTGGFSNSGVVTVQDSTLLLGYVDSSVLANIAITDSTVGIVGTVDATGATIDVGAGTKLGNVIIGLSYPGNGGSYAGIQGGTIHDAGGGLTIEGNVTFTDVTYQGVMSVNAAYAVVSVSDLTVESKSGKTPGTLVLSGAQSVLSVAGGTTLDDATIDIGSSIIRQGGMTLGAPTIESQGFGEPPFLGANLVIDQTAKYASIGGNSAYFDTNSDATINAAFEGGQMLLDGDTFVSGGAINIGAGELVTSAAGSFANTGSLSIASGSTLALNLLNYYVILPDSATSFENEGQMVLTGGTITEQSGKGIPPVPLRNDSAGNISGIGVIAAEIANYGTVTATGGELTLSQAISGGGGVLDVAASATLSLLGSVSAGETAQFGGADGVLGLSAKHFLGEIGGFANGDTIDLLKLSAASAEFSGSSIAVTLTTGGTISLATTQPLSGSLTVTGDGHGGSLIAFAGALADAAVVPVIAEAVAPAWVQPEGLNADMAFWDAMMQHYGH